ncbi:DNA polymerase IV [Methylocystis bryophila]|nr:DNA polymerase IV [Methylocystis bryophila]BDV37081.1 DNA polymerase IV [Methylocystis bryophila]
MRASSISPDNEPCDTAGERPRKIIHIDMDAFYASVEQRDNPALRGKPVAVGGAGGRGVVAAASYEARAFGVRSAMPSVTARRKCPQLLFVPPRFEVYRQVSRQIRAIFAEHTPLIEPLSLDEAYLDVTENLKGVASATRLAEEIRAKIRAETGLTASAGVSYNKFLAKIASDYRKPDGLFVITPQMGPGFVEALEIGRFHGIGPVTRAKMNKLGVSTGKDLRAQSLEFLERHFGKAGAYFYSIARGIDARPVRPDRVRKSLGAERTFAEDLFTLDAAQAALAPILEKVWRASESAGLAARTITLKVKFADFRQITRARTCAARLQNRQELEAVVCNLLASAFPARTESFERLGIAPSEKLRACPDRKTASHFSGTGSTVVLAPKGVRLLGLTLSSFDAPASIAEASQLALDLTLAPPQSGPGRIGAEINQFARDSGRAVR